MNTDEIKEKIIARLKNCDQFHPATIGELAFAVFGEKMALDKRNEQSYINQVFSILSILETEDKVQNVNRLPTTDTLKVMKASRWLLK